MIATPYLHATDQRAYPIRSLAVPGAAILGACAVQAPYGHLLVLTSDGGICGADLDQGTVTRLCTVRLPELPARDAAAHFGPPTWRLHANASGTFCAIVVDKGRQGIVVETSSGKITMTLDGGDYYDETVPFSACFLRVDGQDVFVHRTDWNRLDATDPATGQSLTERHAAPREEDGPNPLHYLDYFQGRLWPSPDGSRILDDGWVWHPVSVPRIWSALDWLRANPWETEDGASVVELSLRDDWNTPACWIDNRRVAIWGVVDRHEESFDEVGQRPGVEISDAASRDRASDERWPIDVDGRPRALFCDGKRLFIVGESGTAVWDIPSHSMLPALPGFSAHLHDARRGTLLAIDDGVLTELTLP